MHAPELEDRILEHIWTEVKNSQALLSSRESLWKLFSTIARDPALGAIYCVLDGLDECDEESVRWLVTKLKKLFSEGRLNKLIRLVVVSREIAPMKALTLATKCAWIKLESEHDEQVRDDVVRFVSGSVKKFASMEGFIPEFETG